eukprot:3271405-Amphidinium_carterae.1
MSLPRVAENDVMEMDVSSPPDDGGASYASVTSGATSQSSSGTSWSWQASGAASSGAASSGWSDWQADVRTDGDSDPR